MTAREDRLRAEARLAALQDRHRSPMRSGRTREPVEINGGGGRDPLAHIAEMIGALREGAELLMAKLEVPAGEEPAVDFDRLEARDAGHSLQWLRPGNLPEPPGVAGVAASVERAGDEMVRLLDCERLVYEYPAADDRRRAELISDLGFTAVLISRSLIAPRSMALRLGGRYTKGPA